MVGQRRNRVLGRGGTRRPAQSLDEALALATQTPAEAALDLPFVLFGQTRSEARRPVSSQTGLEPGGPPARRPST